MLETRIKHLQLCKNGRNTIFSSFSKYPTTRIHYCRTSTKSKNHRVKNVRFAFSRIFRTLLYTIDQTKENARVFERTIFLTINSKTCAVAVVRKRKKKYYFSLLIMRLHYKYIYIVLFHAIHRACIATNLQHKIDCIFIR